MSFKKLGEAIEIKPSDIQSAESVIPVIEASVLEQMKKFAAGLKRIAPKADDFLYFSAIMLHAAEAALINEDGTPRLTKSGEPVQAHWDKRGGSWRWISNDPSVRPLKNSNGDIFPEEELIKAYKKWIGRPLCIDHKSSSVDHVRGFIVDTYYDRNLKRVIGLCALDKFNYPDLARKISTGYSNSVSMGTAVERAICYDCGTVAKTEHDFCQHMRSKSCYGEINIGLNPIELSIVVNGADPAAKIKHIIAAANTLNSYVEEKEEQLERMGKVQYTANLNFNQNNDDTGIAEKSGSLTITADTLDAFKNDLDRALDQFQSLNSSTNEEKLSSDSNSTAYNQSSGTIAMQETEMPGTELTLAPPTDRFASLEDLETQLSTIKSSIENKLSHLQQKLSELTNTKEDTMSGKTDNLNKQGYFQGGGGVNEPTPGEKKYPVDPTNEDLREHDDKQMVGQKPFPDVGPVDGMYPGYKSFPAGELEWKKMLARAEADQRALRRDAVVEDAKRVLEAAKKEAYFQNGLDAKNPNTPTPHQRKYPVDPMNEDLREHDDKQMVGQKPFPDVGDVDGLHPSPLSAEPKNELDRKKKLLRAGLRVKFLPVKTAAGSIDYANSTWNAYNDDVLVFSKTVDEITNGQAEALFNTVASKTFMEDLYAKIKAVGANNASLLFKKGQVPPPATSNAGPMSGGADAPAVPAMPDMGGAPDDSGKDGDPKASAMETAEKIRDLASDLVEMERALSGKEAEMGSPDEAMPALPASADDAEGVTTAELVGMERMIIRPLIAATKEAVASLNESAGELNSMVGLYDSGAVTSTNKDFVDNLLEGALVEANEAMADSFKLLGAFAQFANADAAIEARSEQESKAYNKQSYGDKHMEPGNKEILGMLGDTDGVGPQAADSAEANDVDLLNAMLADDLAAAAAVDSNEAVVTSDPASAIEMAKQNPGVDIEVKKAALETKAGRQALRAKLAAEMKWNPILKEFHPKDHALPGPLDTKPSDNLEVVENIAERHEKMLDVATAPPHVRKDAAEIQKLITTGALELKDVDLLVSHGLDPAAVKYWKEFYGEVGPEGKEFATELVKEHVKAQMEQENALYKVKLARSYELAYDMTDCDLLPHNKAAITEQVNELMKFDDAAFESYKRVIERQASSFPKGAKLGRMPQVGLFGAEDAKAATYKTDRELLAEAFASHSNPKRMF
jgi:hypothetical protein